LPVDESDVTAIASALESLGYQKAEMNPPLRLSLTPAGRLDVASAQCFVDLEYP